MSFREMDEKVRRVRFALPAPDEPLMEWLSACEYAGTPDTERLRLEAVGRARGARPADWFAIAEPLPFCDG
jgi:hypothetical protein